MLRATLEASAFSVLMFSVVYWPLERLWPARRQPWLRRALGTDFLFLFGQHLVWSVLALAVLGAIDARLRGALPGGVRDHFLTLPRPAQLVAIVLLGDLAVYWFHRACHRFDVLWRFHAVHHSAQTLDWVAAHREHPVDGLLTQLAVNLPAILLGFPMESLGALAVFRGLWAIFIHSNVRVPLGPLRWVLGAPELHHWHHAKAPGVTANYGNLAPWTDVLFGTHHQPPAGEETFELGVPEPLPLSWAGLLLSPFSRGRGGVAARRAARLPAAPHELSAPKRGPTSAARW
jgi:sterol desaturase/sphingolipid hydroxylase (fatty acid hydroxylase superfamily)